MESPNLVALLRKIGIIGRIGSNGWLRACCPYHSETRPSWGINTMESPHFFSCFSCHAKGPLYRLLIDIGHYTEEDAKRYARLPDAIETNQLVIGKRELGMWPIDHSELFPFDLKGAGAHYIKSRRISPNLARDLGIVYEPELERVLFPWKFRSKLFGVTGRSIHPKEEMKTMPLYGTLKGKFLYLPNARINPRIPLVLVEGEIDALCVYRAGMKNVAALGFGTITKDQADFIRHHSEHIICFFDDDQLGGMLTAKVLKELSGSVRFSSVNWNLMRSVMAVGKRRKLDPGNMTDEEITTALLMVKKNSDFPVL